MDQHRRVPRGYAGAAAAAPAPVQAGQYVANPQSDEVVVFVIGMHINRLRRVRSWWPTFIGMPRMLRELRAADRGLLGAHTTWAGRTFLVIQYWRSAEELGAYARDASLSHAPVWAAFNKRAAATGDVGMFHETYVVPREGIESLYGNMVPFGLGAAHGVLERGRSAARTNANQKLGTTEPAYLDTGA
jgi:hypothetical protein